jgi:hypothetical protein
MASTAEPVLGELGAQIAGHLSALDRVLWDYQAGEQPREGRLAGAGGLVLGLDLWQDKGRWRITIAGQYPHGAISDELPADIGVAASRAARAIAGDISRRLLPRFRAQLADARAAFEQERQDTQARQVLMTRLAALAGRPATHRGPSSSEVSLYDLPGAIFGSVKASGDASTVTITAHNVPAEVAVQAIEVLAKTPPGGCGHDLDTEADVVILRAAAALALQYKKGPFAGVTEYLDELATSLAHPDGAYRDGSMRILAWDGDWRWPMVHRSIALVTGVADPAALAEIEQLMRAEVPALDQLPLSEFHALASRTYARWASWPTPACATGGAG